MSPAVMGAYAGAAFGAISFFTLWYVAGLLEKNAKSREQMRPVGILKAVALIDIVAFTLIGYFVGPMVF
jgi:hypothetical protein